MIFVKSEPTREFIKYCYSTDNTFTDLYHTKNGQGLDICVEDEYLLIIENDVSFYKIYDYNDNIVGWFGKEADNFITSFFILPEHRKTVEWEKILNQFEKPTYTGIYTKNTRACKFFEKLGFKKVEYNHSLNGELVLMER